MADAPMPPKWIFEQSGSGWIIRNGNDINNFLSTDHNSRANGTAIVCSTNQTRWVVQAAEGNTVRIALESSQSMNLDMSTWGGSSNGTKVVLINHTVGAAHQRWELRRVL